MQYRELHPWHVSVTEAQRIQQRLRRTIQIGMYAQDIRYIAGADIALVPTTTTVYAKDRTKPIFVSVGHKMELSQALAILLHCHRGYRIPEPTRLADQYVGTMRRAHGRGTGEA